MLDSFFFFCQWPGLVTGLWGAWLVSGTSQRQRFWGFMLWILSDICWALFGITTNGWALVLTQLVFIVTSSRGMLNNRAKPGDAPGSTRQQK